MLKDATLYFSRGTPSLPTVIQAMDHIDSVFTDITLPSSQKHPAIRAAVAIAKKTLNKYYSLTDASELYRIAIGSSLRFSPPFLHTYSFRKSSTLATNLNISERPVGNSRGSTLPRPSFTHNSSQDMRHLRAGTGMLQSCQTLLPRCVVYPLCYSLESLLTYVLGIPAKSSNNIFDNLPSLAPLQSTALFDELALYLSTELVDTQSPLKWWHEKQSTYPRLSRMALDYLSIPGTSSIFVSSLDCLVVLIPMQLPPLTWSASSVVDGLYSRTPGVVCRLLRRVRSCVSAPGVWRV